MSIASPRQRREDLNLSQFEFWGAIGVSQSAGSRYESGREIPKPTQELYRLTYVEMIDLSKISKEELDIASYIKTTLPDLYQTLKKGAKAFHELSDKIDS